MPAIRLLAIEDDPIYAESLRLVVEELGYLLIDVTHSVDEFRRLVKAAVPDLLLVDIDLGAEIDGIELAREVNEDGRIPVIFLTAFKDTGTINRASQSFPSAYITKPYEAASLQAAIEIAVSKKEEKTPSASVSTVGKETMFLRQEGRFVKVCLADILFVEVKEKYCFVHTKQEEIRVNMRLKDLQEKLPRNRFLQVHRSFLIALDHIDEIDGGVSTIRIGKFQIPVGKNNRTDLVGFLNGNK